MKGCGYGAGAPVSTKSARISPEAFPFSVFLNMTFTNILVVGVAAVILGIAWWQRRRALRANRALSLALEELPAKVVDVLQKFVGCKQTGSAVGAELDEVLPWAVEYADVNEDGMKELLLQHPTGAHGSALRVYVWQDREFRELACLRVGTSAGFGFGDFDGDGRIEIRTEETDWSANLPYVSAPRFILLFRWNGTGFVEVSRQKSVNGTTAAQVPSKE